MLSLAFALLMATAGPDPAATPAPATQSAKPPKAPKPPKICREIESTGSRMPSKICKTQEEWDNQSTNLRGDARVKSAGDSN